MKIQDILTESQLEEISRRDFLKGAGAAGLAAAGVGAAKKADAFTLDKDAEYKIKYALAVYHCCKIIETEFPHLVVHPKIQSHLAICQQLKNSFSRFNKKYPGAARDGILNNYYRWVYNFFKEYKQEKTKDEYLSEVYGVLSRGPNALNDFNSLMEF